MKLASFVTLLSTPLAIGAHLAARQQDNCNRNDCYIAVWGSDLNLVPVRGVVDCERHLTTTQLILPITTRTIADISFTTTTTPCPAGPVFPTLSPPPSATPVPTTSIASSLILIDAKGLKPRQALSQYVVTTTVFGPVPTYAASVCDTGNYRSACLCKSQFSITSASITSLSPTTTSFVTATFTSTVTTGTPCPTPSATTHSSSILETSQSPTQSSSLSSSFSSSATFNLSSSTVSLQSTSSSSSEVSSTAAASLSSSEASSLTSSTKTISSLSSSSSSSSFNTTGTHSSSTPASSTPVLSSSTDSVTPFPSPSASTPPFLNTTSSPLSSTELATSSANLTASASSFSSTVTPSPSSTDLVTSSASLSASTSSSSGNTTSSTGSSTSLLPTPTPICTGNGVRLCNGACHDLRTDAENCGACNNVCAAGKSCTNGVCTSPACDSNCDMDRLCNRNGTTDCICATETGGNGICFNKQTFKCNEPDPLKPRPARCTATAGCGVGFVCVRDYCSCNGTVNGICVNSEGCGLQGTEILGPLMKIGQMEKRRRSL